MQDAGVWVTAEGHHKWPVKQNMQIGIFPYVKKISGVAYSTKRAKLWELGNFLIRFRFKIWVLVSIPIMSSGLVILCFDSSKDGIIA